MIFELDTFEIGGVTNKYDILNVDGLGPSDIRTSQFNFSGRSGGLVTDQFYGMRLVSITGIVRSPTCEQHLLDREAFDEATPISTLIPVHITTFAGSKFIFYANVISLDLEYRSGGKYSDFKLDLLAGDPLFYSEDGGSEQTATVDRVTEGGYVTPYDLPVNWASGSSPTIVLNSGNATSYPIITLHDAAVNPVITNQTTGESFALDITLVDGDVVVIDMRNRTVTLNSGSIVGNKTDDSIWWGLARGDNSILLNSNSASDDIYAVLTWKNGRTGI